MTFITPYVKTHFSENAPHNVPSPSSSGAESQQLLEEDDEDSLVEFSSELPDSNVVLRRKANHDEESIQCFESKKRRIEEVTSARELFLLSVLPDVEKLSDVQFRVFRRKLLDAIDYAGSYQESPKIENKVPVASSTVSSDPLGSGYEHSRDSPNFHEIIKEELADEYIDSLS